MAGLETNVDDDHIAVGAVLARDSRMGLADAVALLVFALCISIAKYIRGGDGLVVVYQAHYVFAALLLLNASHFANRFRMFFRRDGVSGIQRPANEVNM